MLRTFNLDYSYKQPYKQFRQYANKYTTNHYSPK